MKHTKGVVVFGSARLDETTEDYKAAYKFIYGFCLHNPGVPIITGGGPGLMEAANRAAKDCGQKSIGYPINFANNEKHNAYMDYWHMCSSFTERKEYILYDGILFFILPGGMGTLDEFFEIVTLLQLEQRPKARVILLDKQFWTDVFRPMYLMDKGTIDQGSLDLYEIADYDEVIILTKEERSKL